MTVKIGGILVAVLMLVVLAAGLWLQYAKPRRIVATGTIRLDAMGEHAPLTLRTRTVMIGGIRLEEVELPGGTWLDCAGDCARAVRDAGPGFWESLNRNRGGH